MNIRIKTESALQMCCNVLLALAVLCATGLARAQDDPPGRVGRVADAQGNVQWFDHEQGQWQDAVRNLPLTSGDRVATGRQARAELRIGSTTLRLDARSELEVLRLDDERMVFQLHKGSLALRVQSREVADEIEVLTAEVRLRPLRAGHFRVDRLDDTTQAGSWRGELRVDDAFGVSIPGGQRAELWRDGPGRQLRLAWSAMPNDAFSERVAQDDQRDQRDERVVATRLVSPEMTGAEDLDRAGRWDTHPEHGAVWFPLQVRADWAPYRFGRWTWVRPWGWTWVDEAPWGFAPFHYGRWVQWRERWCWVPGAYVARPVYSPALVAWSGGGNWSASVRVGGAPVGWQPLAPRDVYAPWYRHTPVYRGRINHPAQPTRPQQPLLPFVPQQPLQPQQTFQTTQPAPRSSIPTSDGWRHERAERVERSDRYDGSTRFERPERPDRIDRSDRPDRTDRRDALPIIGPQRPQAPQLQPPPPVQAPVQVVPPAQPPFAVPQPQPQLPVHGMPQPVDRPQRGGRAPPQADEQARPNRPPMAPAAPIAAPIAAPVAAPIAAPPAAPERPAAAPVRDDDRKRIPDSRGARGEPLRESQR